MAFKVWAERTYDVIGSSATANFELLFSCSRAQQRIEELRIRGLVYDLFITT